VLALGGRTDEEADAFAAERARQIQPDDAAGLIYTSGTTGQPKGVVHTHRMLLAELACARSMLTSVHPGIIDVLWLPLAHGMGRLEHIFTLEFGGETVIVPSVLHLMRELSEVQPDMMLAVPRLYEQAQAGMTAHAASLPAPQRILFHWAIDLGRRAVPLRQARRPIPLGLRMQLAVADWLVLRRLRAAFGGRLQLAISGGAPIDPSIVTFFHAIGIPVLEAWGLTETTTALTINKLDWFRIGTAGTVFPGNEIRIAPDGEILARGPCIFSCYYKNAEATAEALDAEGWLHTGDIGTLDGDGFMTIIDRKKDLIVTSGGDKIAPQRVEALLDTIPVVAQACVYGDKKSYAVALLTLEWPAVHRWAVARGLDVTDVREVAQSPALRAYLDEQVAQVNARLQIFERVRSYGILTDDFTLENGLLTPTQKIRRKEIVERYRRQFEQLYEATSSAERSAARNGQVTT
jgi:long-chain acyl-CoA synthetase